MTRPARGLMSAGGGCLLRPKCGLRVAGVWRRSQRSPGLAHSTINRGQKDLWGAAAEGAVRRAGAGVMRFAANDLQLVPAPKAPGLACDAGRSDAAPDRVSKSMEKVAATLTASER